MRNVLRLLRSPRWILATVLAISVVVSFIALGFWQLRRWDERRRDIAAVAASLAADPVPLEQLLEGGLDEAIEHRRVTVAGRYQAEAGMLLAPRTRGGKAGAHMLMPLNMESGAVIVDRGWMPAEPSEDLETPSGLVALVGRVRPGDGAGRFNPDTATVTTVDLELLGAESGLDLAPVYVELESQVPAQVSVLPVPAEPPDNSEGNHQLYAVQWFLFAAVVGVGLPLLLYRNAEKAPINRGHR